MALDLRLYNCLPEHQGPAFRTWSQIIQTTAMNGNLASPLLSPTSCSSLESSFPSLIPAEDFLPFSQNGDSGKHEQDDNASLGKRKRPDRSENARFLEDVSHLTFAPWKTSSYPENAYGLHLEIKEFYDYMSPSPEERYMRQSVVEKIQELILTIWPAARTEVFGSFKTNLYLPTSDIDLVVFGNWEKLPLWTLERALVNEEIADSSTIKVLDKASVPIIKLTEKRSNLKVDISFNMDTAVKGAELIQGFLRDHHVLPYLFLVLKHFLVMRDLNEVFTGGISSYCLMLLTVSFLQMHPRQESNLPNANIGVLLIEFFELYGRNFNYQRTGIKIRDGGCYCSKEEIMREMNDGQFPSLLCIEDPVSKVIDIGKSSYGIMRVKEAFEYAYNVLDSALRNRNYFRINPESTYLSRIIRVSPEIIQYRRWVKTHYPLPSNDQHENEDDLNPGCNQNESQNKEKARVEVDTPAEESTSDNAITREDLPSSDINKSSSPENIKLNTNKNKIDEITEKTSELRSDFVKASIVKGEASNSNKGGKKEKDSQHVKTKYSGLDTRPRSNSSDDYTSKPRSSSQKGVIEVAGCKASKAITAELEDAQNNRVEKRNTDRYGKSSNSDSPIGTGGKCQWSSDENLPAESSNEIKNSTTHKLSLSENRNRRTGRNSNSWVAEPSSEIKNSSTLKPTSSESGPRRIVKDGHNRGRHYRSPCEGISEHDLASAQQARQLIISSPEKPCVKPDKWLKEDSRNLNKESQVPEHKQFTSQDERQRDSKKKWVLKDSWEMSDEGNHSKPNHRSEHYHHDDNGHKSATGHRRRSKKDTK